MKDRIAGFGVLLVLMGIVSSVLQLFGYELRALRALDALGPMAWAVRLGLILVGAGLFVVATPAQEPT